jgi:hypothetical protein
MNEQFFKKTSIVFFSCVLLTCICVTISIIQAMQTSYRMKKQLAQPYAVPAVGF